MSMINCCYGDGKCAVPDPAVVVWDGEFSLVSHALLNTFVPDFADHLESNPRHVVEFAIPAELLEALSMISEPEARSLRDAQVEVLRDPGPTDRGIFVRCQPCGHLCIVEP